MVFGRKSIELAKDDTKLLYSCLLICIGYPEQFFSKSIIKNVVTILSKVNNSRVDYVVGKYYFKKEKVLYIFIYWKNRKL